MFVLGSLQPEGKLLNTEGSCHIAQQQDRNSFLHNFTCDPFVNTILAVTRCLFRGPVGASIDLFGREV